jgi:hypothetical protein
MNNYYSDTQQLLLRNGSTVSNNSVVGLEDLPTGTAFLSDYHASWTSPTGDQNTTIFNVNRGGSLLQVERTVSPLQAQHSGVWHCEIPGGKNIYVGLYNQGKDP